MRRLALFLGCLLVATPAFATMEFRKAWQAKFLGDEADPTFVRTAKKANCNVCHVKGKNKKKPDGKNEYGKAVSKFIKAKDFKRAYVNAHPEEAKEKILEGFRQANELESKDGKKFGEKIKANELPATDAKI